MAHREGELDATDAGLERLVFFSDGVLAIAITLLVLDLRVPEIPVGTGDGDLADAVWDMGSAFFSYALSFLVIGIYWQAHRRIFGHIVRGDTVITWLNLVYLMLIAFLPFPTAMRGDYDESRFALIFYAATHVLIGTVSLSMWLYATHRGRLTRTNLPRTAVWSGFVNGAVPMVVFLVSIGVAFIDTDLAMLTWIGLVLARPVRRVVVER